MALAGFVNADNSDEAQNIENPNTSAFRTSMAVVLVLKSNWPLTSRISGSTEFVVSLFVRIVH